MSALKLLCLVCSGLVCCQAAAEELVWRDLFNGHDLSGWVDVNTSPETWSVRDGLLVCTGQPIGVMRTDRQYENFIIDVEWRHMEKGGNSGMFLWSDARPQASRLPMGMEVQMLELDWVNQHRLPDGSLPPIAYVHGELFGAGGMTAIPDNPRGNRSKSLENRCKPAGQWNRYIVVAVDGTVKLAVNGKFVNGIREASCRKGYICLESEGKEIHFRKIRIMELPPGMADAATTAPLIQTVAPVSETASQQSAPPKAGAPGSSPIRPGQEEQESKKVAPQSNPTQPRAATADAANNRTRRVNPAMQPIEDVPGLQRILLIGDSISIGYTLPVRELLKGRANVHRPPTNCGPTTKGVEELDQWLAKQPWDVIHFNFGLHDLKYMGPNGENLADPQDPTSHQQVPPEEYEQNLRKIVARLKQTGAKLIWRNTTPVPPGAKGRVVGDSARYNAIAEKIMREEGIPIDDHYTYVKEQIPQLQLPANVHFTPEGYRKLAERVVVAIQGVIDLPSAPQEERP
ncbi:MAG: DUF1080 domain-containing protein [Planctomycetota bacterium]|nr:MAG: DUF1080 domain-containing protein [Planctomycetota bacterium]